MDVGVWCNYSGRRDYDRFHVPVRNLVAEETARNVPIWKASWRKIKRQKKKYFDCSTSLRYTTTYDPYTYTLNFDDQSLIWADPDDLCRSFSARSAVPARIFDQEQINGGGVLVL